MRTLCSTSSRKGLSYKQLGFLRFMNKCEKSQFCSWNLYRFERANLNLEFHICLRIGCVFELFDKYGTYEEMFVLFSWYHLCHNISLWRISTVREIKLMKGLVVLVWGVSCIVLCFISVGCCVHNNRQTGATCVQTLHWGTGQLLQDVQR